MSASTAVTTPPPGRGLGMRDLQRDLVDRHRHFGPVTIHEIALQISHAQPATGGSDVTAVEADISFSAQLGVAYFRVDRMGLALIADTSKPPHERNLRFVDLRLGAKPPLGIAVNVDTSLISGGGTIFHDPAQGIYFGALTLRIKTRFLLKAIGLVSTKNADGTPGSSFIIIATLEVLGWQIGPVPSTASACCTPPNAPSTRTRCGRRCRPANCATCCSRPTRCTIRPRRCGRSARSFRRSPAAR